MLNVPRNPHDRTFDVWRRQQNGIVACIGVVVAGNQVQADTKAKQIFGHNVWTKERVSA